MSDAGEHINRKGTCAAVRAGEPFVGKQGLTYATAISAETVGARGLHMQLLTIPPGARTKAHKHAHETAIYQLSGEAGTWYGERLERHIVSRAGDFVYIPADTPHLAYNRSQTETVTAVVARTDPNDRESAVMLPDLDAIHP